MLQAGRRNSELMIFALIVGGVLYGLLAYFLVPLLWAALPSIKKASPG